MPSPYDSLLDSPKSPYDALLEDKPSKSPYDALLSEPSAPPASTVQPASLSKDYDPVEHAADVRDDKSAQEAAYQVYKQRAQNPESIPTKVGGFVKGAAKTILPTTDDNGQWHWPLAAGAINLAKGVVQTGKNIVAMQEGPNISTTPGLNIPQLVSNLWNEDPAASKAGRTLAAGTQEGLLQAAQMTGNVRHAISGAAGALTNGAIGATPAQLSDEDLRKRFDDEVHYRYLSKQAQKGILPSESESGETHGLTPEQLAAAGHPIDPEEIQNVAGATNPANLLELGAVTSPIARGVMSPIVKVAGKVATVASNALDTAHLGRLAGAGGALYSLYHGNPLGIAEAAIAPAVTKAVSSTGRAVGNLLTQTGEEMAGGNIPLGQSAVRKVVKEGIKGAAGAVPTGAAFAMTGNTPEEAGSQFANAVGLGGLLSAASAVPKSGASGAIERQAAGQQLAHEGATTNFGTGYDAWHQEAMQSMSPQDADAINKYRGFLGRLRTADGKPIQVYAVNGPRFSDVQKQMGEVDATGNATNPNGRGLISKDGSQIFVNTDAAGSVNEPLAHETGHAADLVAKYADSLLSQSLQSNLAQHLYQQSPHGPIPTKEFADFMDNYQKSVGAKTMSRQDFESEYVAETARKILQGENIENFTLPKSLGDKISQGAQDFLSNIGIKPKNGKIGFGGTEIQAISRNVSDLLRQPTPNEPAPTSAQYRLEQLKTTLENRPPANATVEQLDQYAAAKKEFDDLTKKMQTAAGSFPAAGKAPIPPGAPVAPTGMGDIPRVAAYLRQQGLSAQEATQWATAAKGGSIEEKVIDALRQRANQKFPTTNVPTSPTNEPVPAKPGASQPTPAVAPAEAPANTGGVAVAEKPVPAKPEPAKVNRSTPEEAARVKALVKTARDTATAAEKRPNTKAAQERIQRAVINAVLDDIGNDPTGLHKETDQFGNERIIGDFDPSDPRHAALAEIGGLDKDSAKTLEAMQAAKGKPVYVRYRSAISSQDNNKGDADTGMVNRQAEYELDPASERTEGTIQHKVIIPVGTEMNSPSGKIGSTFMVLDNVLHNAASIFEGLTAMGRTNPYGKTANEQQPLLIRDAQVYADNHAHGYKGDGSGPIKSFPDSGFAKVDPNYTPEQIPQDRFAVLNMAFHDENAGKLSARMDKLAARQSEMDAETNPNKKAAKARQIAAVMKGISESQEMHALAAQNNPWVDHQTGETNQLRAEMKAAGFDLVDRLKSPFETLAPKHILETSDNPLPLQEGDIPTVRPHGFDVDAAQIGAKGLPNQKAVGAAFLPSERIVGPALLNPDGTMEKGQIGDEHRTLMQNAAQRGDDFTDAKHVFYDDQGQPRTREEAWTIAKNAGMIKPAVIGAKERLAASEGKAPQLASQDLQKGAFIPSDESKDIYRADTQAPGAGKHWTDDKTAAHLYRYNPGFGGPDLFRAEIPKGNILHMEGRSDWMKKAKEVGEHFDSERPYDLVYRPEFQKWLRDNDYAGASYEDDFPEGSKTVFLLDEPKSTHLPDDQHGQWNALSEGLKKFPRQAYQPAIETLAEEISKREKATRDGALENYQILKRDFTESELEEMLRGGPDKAWDKWRTDVLGENPDNRAQDEGSFLPAEKYDPQSDKTPVINEGDPAWIQRWEELYQNEYQGKTLTDKEEKEQDELHQRIIREYGSLNAFDKARKSQGIEDIHEPLRKTMRPDPKAAARDRLSKSLPK